MSFLRFLKSEKPPVDDRSGTQAAEIDAIRRIVSRLETLPPERARFLAAAAYILARAAYADLEISEAETDAMERELVDRAGLDQAQAILVVEMAKLQERATGATNDYLITRELAELATLDERIALLHACYRICVADESLSGMEASTLNQIAGELGLDRPQAAAVRAEFADKLSARHGF